MNFVYATVAIIASVAIDNTIAVFCTPVCGIPLLLTVLSFPVFVVLFFEPPTMFGFLFVLSPVIIFNCSFPWFLSSSFTVPVTLNIIVWFPNVTVSSATDDNSVNCTLVVVLFMFFFTFSFNVPIVWLSFAPALIVAKNVPFFSVASSLYAIDQLFCDEKLLVVTFSNMFSSYTNFPPKLFIPSSPISISDRFSVMVISSPSFRFVVLAVGVNFKLAACTQLTNPNININVNVLINTFFI